MIGKTIDQLKVGDTEHFSKTVSEADIYLFAGVSGDFNPAHVDEQYAEKTFFKTRIAHGMLSAGFISTIIGTKLPGTGSIYVKQSLEFKAPVRIGDTITATGEIIEIDTEKHRVRLKTTCTNQKGVVVIDGEAIVSPPKAPKK